MASYTSVLLLVALCIASAYSLKCYTCAAAKSNSNCKTETTCDSGEGYCQTVVGSASFFGISATSITKSCAATCTATSDTLLGATAYTSCCTTDLCNVSGAISIKSSYSIIFLVGGTIVMLISSSLL